MYKIYLVLILFSLSCKAQNKKRDIHYKPVDYSVIKELQKNIQLKPFDSSREYRELMIWLPFDASIGVPFQLSHIIVTQDSMLLTHYLFFKKDSTFIRKRTEIKSGNLKYASFTFYFPATDSLYKALALTSAVSVRELNFKRIDSVMEQLSMTATPAYGLIEEKNGNETISVYLPEPVYLGRLGDDFEIISDLYKIAEKPIIGNTVIFNDIQRLYRELVANTK